MPPATPTMPCPECGAKIPLDVHGLIAGEALTCPGCGVKVTLSPESPRTAALAKALEQLGRKKDGR